MMNACKMHAQTRNGQQHDKVLNTGAQQGARNEKQHTNAASQIDANNYRLFIKEGGPPKTFRVLFTIVRWLARTLPNETTKRNEATTWVRGEIVLKESSAVTNPNMPRAQAAQSGSQLPAPGLRTNSGTRELELCEGGVPQLVLLQIGLKRIVLK